MKKSLFIFVLIMIILFVTGCSNPFFPALKEKVVCSCTAGAEATCITDQTCTKCGIIIQAMLGHNWNWIITTQPNFGTNTPGVETKTCKKCVETDGTRGYPIFTLGETGPAGGKIIYRAPGGFLMTDDGSIAYYLEAAPENIATMLRWSTLTFTEFEASGYNPSLWIDIPGTGIAIGTGRKNTSLILALDLTAPAALECVNYFAEGYESFNDWFLPSREELNELYRRRDDFDLSSGIFWSSSQFSFPNDVWTQFFDDGWNGYQLNARKTSTFNVRAIRAF